MFSTFACLQGLKILNDDIKDSVCATAPVGIVSACCVQAHQSRFFSSADFACLAYPSADLGGDYLDFAFMQFYSCQTCWKPNEKSGWHVLSWTQLSWRFSLHLNCSTPLYQHQTSMRRDGSKDMVNAVILPLIQPTTTLLRSSTKNQERDKRNFSANGISWTGTQFSCLFSINLVTIFWSQ